jgi:hypothetical protein
MNTRAVAAEAPAGHQLREDLVELVRTVLLREVWALNASRGVVRYEDNGIKYREYRALIL